MLDRFLIDVDEALPSGCVRTDVEARDACAIDESEATPVRPEAVIEVSETAHVAAVLRAATEHGVFVTPRAAGTGRVGGAVPVRGGVVLSMTGMNRLRGIEPRDGLVVAGAGVVTGELHDRVEAEGLFYGPDPNSSASCTIGGNVAANAGGPRAYEYGVTRDWVLGMQVVTADGTVLDVGRRTRKGVTGYDVTALLVGSEGTLGVVTEVTLRLVPRPQRVGTLMVLLDDEAAVARALEQVTARGMRPRCAELLDRHALSVVRSDAKLPIPHSARAMLLVEVDGDEMAVNAALESCGNAFVDAGALDVLVARDEGDRRRLWMARQSLSRSLRRLAKKKLSEDVVVPPSQLAALLAHVRVLSETTGIRMPAYGHAGDGNLHVNYLWDEDEERPAVDDGIARLFERVIALGGTLSGEHGIGVMKAPFVPLEQAPELIALQKRIKNAFDPEGILNPGKIFPADARRFHGAC